MTKSAAATGPVYRVLGTTDDVTECQVCGKVELKGTMALDMDGTTVFAGFTCGAWLAGRPVRELRTEAKAADQARRDAEQAVRDAAAAAERAAFAAWVLARYGLTITQTGDLWAHQDVTGLRPFQVLQLWKQEA